MDGNEGRQQLFAAIAVQTELLRPEQLAQAYAIWARSPAQSLPEILCDHGMLVPSDRAHLDYLVERRLARFGGDVPASLAGYAPEICGLPESSDHDTSRDLNITGQHTLAFEESASEMAPRRYTLNKLHAAGGIGEIWLARDTDLQRDVAIKRLQSGSAGSAIAKTRFLREAKITGQLDHPGVVPIYEICREANGQPYYSMRFLKGRTLTEAVKQYHRQRRLSGPDLQRFLGLLGAFGIVCNTVAYAHAKGIVHRDLKCDNVILGDYGEVVVIDWGLAKEVGGVEADLSHGASVEARPSADPTATLAGHILGTPAYMAPEQAAGHLERIGPPTDVYGLSAILYEILTGQPPFVGDTTLDVLRQVEYQEPARPSTIVAGVPEGLEQICLKGLAKEPAERHPSADSLARAVQSWVSELTERRQSEEERERFFALSLDLLAIIDDGGRLRQVGPAWSRLLGYEREQLAGRLLLRYPVPSRLRIARSQRPGAMALRADICETRSEFLAPSRGLLDEDVFTEGRLGLKCLRCRSFDQPYGVGIGQLGQDRSSIRAAEFD